MESGEYTSSLMFGVQWDLVLKYLETKNAATVAELKGGDGVGSTNWGNYQNNLWNIANESAKYSTNNGSTYTVAPYKKTAHASILLTTGADNTFSKMGIYDIAGNVWEWTLECTSNSSFPCADRGGGYTNYGDNFAASYRNNISTTNASYRIGLRASLF